MPFKEFFVDAFIFSFEGFGAFNLVSTFLINKNIKKTYIKKLSKTQKKFASNQDTCHVKTSINPCMLNSIYFNLFHSNGLSLIGLLFFTISAVFEIIEGWLHKVYII